MTSRVCMKHRALYTDRCHQCKAERQAHKNKTYNDPEYRRNREALLNSSARCERCGTTKDLTVDHIVPASLNGGSHRANLRVLCRPCNSRRGGFLRA